MSERIRRFGHERAVPGDVVLEKDAVAGQIDMEIDELDDIPQSQGADQIPGKKVRNEKKPSFKISTDNASSVETSTRKPRYQAPKVKVLTETDVMRYSIFDVVMPLPGKDVAFPGGDLGQMYREFLVKDGLDPDNFDRKQK